MTRAAADDADARADRLGKRLRTVESELASLKKEPSSGAPWWLLIGAAIAGAALTAAWALGLRKVRARRHEDDFDISEVLNAPEPESEVKVIERRDDLSRL